MREIKFRAWDGEALKMRNWEELLSLPEGLVNALTGKIRDFILMQCTGVKDKNGKEIYEGDILSCMGGNVPYVVEWLDAGFYLLFEGEAHVPEDALISESGFDWTVVGNIYENPELL